jgi:hypothetical protein
MAAKARYDGPYPAVDVELPNGQVVTVERGHNLPAKDSSDETIPASVRDDLLSRSDWSEVAPAASPSEKKED